MVGERGAMKQTNQPPPPPFFFHPTSATNGAISAGSALTVRRLSSPSGNPESLDQPCAMAAACCRSMDERRCMERSAARARSMSFFISAADSARGGGGGGMAVRAADNLRGRAQTTGRRVGAFVWWTRWRASCEGGGERVPV